ncbi:hypothetical protein SAMN02194393_04611 [Maledivibacter halophilus]|uniref:Uncharacterized protein n=1 Tax=Maledivibacter halophilus TaxID=36842 RepID=A0A1T5MFG7_9FIRM|nr:hypothetical protein SAMN02194393_04611 [Maledivibacter halophilus]
MQLISNFVERDSLVCKQINENCILARKMEIYVEMQI